jgi:hypothetical protein
MSEENCECNCNSLKGPLSELEGDEIVEVRVVGGGSKYCNIIEMKLKSGKYFVIERYLDVSKYGIDPKLSYNIGSWFEG